MQQGLDAGVGEPQWLPCAGVDGKGSLHVLEGSFADEAVMADALDVEQTSVGRKADLTQFLEVLDASDDGEVAGIVDRRLGSERLSLLVILLMRALLVVDVQRRNDAVGDDPGTASAWCAAGDLAVEDQADLAGPADVEVLADHLLEEDASGDRLVEDLGEGELGLRMESW